MSGTLINSNTRAEPTQSEPMTTQRQRLVLLACILGSSAAFLDGTLVNVALPAIRSDLHGGLAAQEWIIDAYLLTLGSLLLVGGSLGDLFGRRRVFATGVAGFGASSLLCAAAPTATLLIAARGLQGIAGALLVPSTLALIMDTFPEEQRAAAIGSWTAWTGIATVLGPLVGGALIGVGSWRWVFVVNGPLVLATLWLVRHAAISQPSSGGKVDWGGGLLCAFGLGGPIFALIEQPTYGWSNVRVFAPLLLGSLLLVAFVSWESRSRTPMLPLSLFRTRNFAVGNLATFAFYAALSTMTFFLIVFLQQVAGYSPLTAGLALLPMSILTFLLAKRFGALADRIGPSLFMGIGPLIAAGGLLLLLRVGAHAAYVTQVLPGMTMFALGLAMTVAPLTAAVLGAVTSAHSGVAAAVNNAVARIAGLIAIAAVGAAVSGDFASRVQSQLRGGPDVPVAAVHHAGSKPLVIDASGFPPATRPMVRRVLVSASVDSYRLAIGVAASLAIISGLLSLVGIANPRRKVLAADCPGGAICGASVDSATAPLSA